MAAYGFEFRIINQWRYFARYQGRFTIEVIQIAIGSPKEMGLRFYFRFAVLGVGFSWSVFHRQQRAMFTARWDQFAAAVNEISD